MQAVIRSSCRSLPLVLCLLALGTACGCAAKSVAPPPPAERIQARPATARAAKVIRTARVLLGYPYKWGGYLPDTGFDCSGLIWFVYHQNGVNLPRVSYRQFAAGASVKRTDVRPGDLVFYRVDKKGKSLHGGIVTDRGTFIHAPSSGKKVMESSLNSPYWHEHYLGARRVL
ncbi:MAG: C40 family peptidase [Desulfovibrionaceae bacterium]|nr:C40 family peptidase [Desulfovibrionaceae bacterium]